MERAVCRGHPFPPSVRDREREAAVRIAREIPIRVVIGPGVGVHRIGMQAFDVGQGVVVESLVHALDLLLVGAGAADKVGVGGTAFVRIGAVAIATFERPRSIHQKILGTDTLQRMAGRARMFGEQPRHVAIRAIKRVAGDATGVHMAANRGFRRPDRQPEVVAIDQG